jgi:hypothetical protein
MKGLDEGRTLVKRPTYNQDRRHAALLRLGRSVIFTIFANPFAFIAASLALGVLFHVFRALLWGHAHEHGLGFEDVLICSACAVTLILVLLLACGHIVMLFFIGWRNSRGAHQ